MLKEIAIILGAIGCIFLIIPVYWVFYTSGPIGLSVPLVLLGIILVYALYDVTKLFENDEGNIAMYFLLSLIAAIVFSIFILFEIFPYFASKFLPIA